MAQLTVKEAQAIKDAAHRAYNERVRDILFGCLEPGWNRDGDFGPAARCGWLARCTNVATHTVYTGPSAGTVPACDTCHPRA